VLDRGYANFHEKALFVKPTWRPCRGRTQRATRSGRSEQKRRLKASGVVRSLLSSITSPLSGSMRHTGRRSSFVAEIKTGCNLWLLFATITHGPILLPGPL
jgi:hypothetical protein